MATKRFWRYGHICPWDDSVWIRIFLEHQELDPYNQPEETHLESHGPFSLAPIILADLTDLPVIQVYQIKIRGNWQLMLVTVVTHGKNRSSEKASLDLANGIVNPSGPAMSSSQCHSYNRSKLNLEVRTPSSDLKNFNPTIRLLSLLRSTAQLHYIDSVKYVKCIAWTLLQMLAHQAPPFDVQISGDLIF